MANRAFNIRQDGCYSVTRMTHTADRSVGDRSGAISDPTTSECSIWGVAVATTAHTRNSLFRGSQSAVCAGKCADAAALGRPLRPVGGMLLLWSACLTWGNR